MESGRCIEIFAVFRFFLTSIRPAFRRVIFYQTALVLKPRTQILKRDLHFSLISLVVIFLAEKGFVFFCTNSSNILKGESYEDTSSAGYSSLSWHRLGPEWLGGFHNYE
jgi:hypothetical protein